MIFLIIIAANFFARFFAISQIGDNLLHTLMGGNLDRSIILVVILIIWFLLGMIIIPTGIMLLTLPIIFPLVLHLGYDPIWFGIICIKMSEIAGVTPPIGLNIYALKSVAGEGTSLEEIFRGIWPFVVCDILVLILLIAFPKIALFLPNLIYK